MIDLPDSATAAKLRMVRLGNGKATDFFVSSESQAVLLLRPAGPLHSRPCRCR